MKKIICSFIFSLLLCQTSHAQIISAYYDDLRASMWIFTNLDNRTALYEAGLTDCQLEQKTFFGKAARNFVVSKYIPAFIIYSEGKNIKIFDTFTNKTENIDIGFSKPVRLVAQSENGEYISVTDGLTVYLLTFEKEKLKTVFKKEFIADVSAIFFDDENNLLYTAERSGVLSTWTPDGKRANSTDTKTVIVSMQADNIFGRIIAVTKNGIYAIEREKLNLLTILSDKSITEAYLDNTARRFIIVTKAGAAIYNYPDMKVTAFFPKAGGKIIETGGKNFTAFINSNSIGLFDLKVNAKIGSISVEYNGVSFYPPENSPLNFSGGITSSFIDAVANNNKTPQTANNLQKICAPIAAMVSGVYTPLNLVPAQTNLVNSPSINEIKMKQIKEPSSIPQPNEPSVGFIEIGNIPDTIDMTGFQNPNNPKEPVATRMMPMPEMPQTAAITLHTGGGVPNWVANGKNLPQFNAMAGGKTIQEAFDSAKKIIKNEITRNVIQKIINKPEIDTIDDENIKKRFLWQIGSGAAIALEKNITAADQWTSPAQMKYVHAIINENLIEKNAEQKFNEEWKILNSKNHENYMKINPNKID